MSPTSIKKINKFTSSKDRFFSTLHKQVLKSLTENEMPSIPINLGFPEITFKLHEIISYKELILVMRFA